MEIRDTRRNRCEFVSRIGLPVEQLGKFTGLDGFDAIEIDREVGDIIRAQRAGERRHSAFPSDGFRHISTLTLNIGPHRAALPIVTMATIAIQAKIGATPLNGSRFRGRLSGIRAIQS